MNGNISSNRCDINDFKIPAFTGVYCAILVVGVAGNGTALYVFVCLTRRKTANIIFMINLAISDLLFNLTLPTRIAYEWPPGTFLCRISSYAFYLNLYSSILFLATLSVFRYIANVHPVQAKSLLTVRRLPHHLALRGSCRGALPDGDSAGGSRQPPLLRAAKHDLETAPQVELHGAGAGLHPALSHHPRLLRQHHAPALLAHAVAAQVAALLSETHLHSVHRPLFLPFLLLALSHHPDRVPTPDDTGPPLPALHPGSAESRCGDPVSGGLQQLPQPPALLLRGGELPPDHQELGHLPRGQVYDDLHRERRYA